MLTERISDVKFAIPPFRPPPNKYTKINTYTKTILWTIVLHGLFREYTKRHLLRLVSLPENGLIGQRLEVSGGRVCGCHLAGGVSRRTVYPSSLSDLTTVVFWSIQTTGY